MVYTLCVYTPMLFNKGKFFSTDTYTHPLFFWLPIFVFTTKATVSYILKREVTKALWQGPEKSLTKMSLTKREQSKLLCSLLGNGLY